MVWSEIHLLAEELPKEETAKFTAWKQKPDKFRVKLFKLIEQWNSKELAKSFSGVTSNANFLVLNEKPSTTQRHNKL